MDALKAALNAVASGSTRHQLSDEQYSAGFDAMMRGNGEKAYQEFIVPQLRRTLSALAASRGRQLSVLEIGPGSTTVLGQLPADVRGTIGSYVAFEPNANHADWLTAVLQSSTTTAGPGRDATFPSLTHGSAAMVVPHRFALDTPFASRFDVVLFCHSMYGMRGRRDFLRRAIRLLVLGGVVIVFHRQSLLHDLQGLVCHRVATWPTGSVSVKGDDQTLDAFAPFVAGQTVDVADRPVRDEWRAMCRALGTPDEEGRLVFANPEVMLVFNENGDVALSYLASMGVPLEPNVDGACSALKNYTARNHRPACIASPTEIREVQALANWAREFGVGLTVVGGGHGGQCLWPNVTAVNMAAFNGVHVVEPIHEGLGPGPAADRNALLVVYAGCKTGDVIRTAAAAGVSVPLGARPSVGAGLWLQGGIGHLSRLHRLSSDSIIGAVIVSVSNGKILRIGVVPKEHCPEGAVAALNEDDLLWALRGAGTNLGIVICVTFRTCKAPTYHVRSSVVPLVDDAGARLSIGNFERLVARRVPQFCSADAFLYHDNADNKLKLGVATFHIASHTRDAGESMAAVDNMITNFTRSALVWPAMGQVEKVDGVGVFDKEMYMSTAMHGGHGAGKSDSFKRCVFLHDIADGDVVDVLIAAMMARPTRFCYMHLLHGGGAISAVAPDDTAFGCRDWEFACVVTGVWLRGGEPQLVDAVVAWVYGVVEALMGLCQCRGVYGADLGPDPRDAVLASDAFGPNLARLARIKHAADPRGVLSYATPLPTPAQPPRLVVLVSGVSCAGKDHSAATWAQVLASEARCTVRVVSISAASKQAYAAASPGVDLGRLLRDRAYKEEHRPALARFYRDQVEQNPDLPHAHFRDVVTRATADAVANGFVLDVLIVTGVRDEAPVTTMAHLVPHSKVIDVRVVIDEQVRRARGGKDGGGHPGQRRDQAKAADYRPTLTFDNSANGSLPAASFARDNLLMFAHPWLLSLEAAARKVPDFPRGGIEFRYVLNIAQQPGGLAFCTDLILDRLGATSAAEGVVGCEAGGFVFAAPVAARRGAPLLLVRHAGKLPPPTVSVARSPSHISAGGESTAAAIEMNVPSGRGLASVLLVDDVLASGETLRAVMELLLKARVVARAGQIRVVVVGEFPVHRGRQFLRENGFGSVQVDSLLIFGGV